jgi:hypothetical protein
MTSEAFPSSRRSSRIHFGPLVHRLGVLMLTQTATAFWAVVSAIEQSNRRKAEQLIRRYHFLVSEHDNGRSAERVPPCQAAPK